MFIADNKIIIVDDVKSELQLLSNQFYKNGIGCTACEYDAFFSTPFSGVRIAFFDIDINPSGGSTESQIFNSVATAIKQYISIDNGPFALIFWTKIAAKVERLKAHIEARHKDCPKPFLVNYIDKDEFHDERKSLEKKLKDILGDKTLEIILDFENAAVKAAQQTTNQIFKIIPAADSWGISTNFNLNFEKIFSKIATSTLGFTQSQTNADRAVHEALLPILNFHLLNLKKSKRWHSLLTSLRSARKLTDIKGPTGFKESTLNTIFHIDNFNLKKNSRGVAIKMNNSKKRINDTFDCSYDDWVKSLVSFKTEFKAAESAARISEINLLISNSQLIAIEISSACDYQQNKKRLNKYLFGILIDPINKELLASKAEFSFKAGTFLIHGKEREVWVNLNYVFGVMPNDKRLGAPLFLFKKEMMDMIGNRYANHVSRIGITSF